MILVPADGPVVKGGATPACRSTYAPDVAMMMLPEGLKLFTRKFAAEKLVAVKFSNCDCVNPVTSKRPGMLMSPLAATVSRVVLVVASSIDP